MLLLRIKYDNSIHIRFEHGLAKIFDKTTNE